jgi:hypothetical protein
MAESRGGWDASPLCVWLAAVGDFSKPAMEMGGGKVLWQGGGAVSQFEVEEGPAGAHR